MQKFLKILGITVRVILILLIALLLVYDICVMVQKYALKRDLPVFFGYASAVIASDSMYPEICKGDLVIIDVNADYGTGDVITYYNSDSGAYITHRIVAENGMGGYFTKGDNSDSVDNITVTDDIIYGKVVNVLGGVGVIIAFIQQPAGMILSIAIIVLAWVFVWLARKLYRERKTLKQKDE